LWHNGTVTEKAEAERYLHTFRHSFISRAIVQGIPEAIIRSWVGHVDHKKLQHFTHIADRESQAAMQRLTRPGAWLSGLESFRTKR